MSLEDTHGRENVTGSRTMTRKGSNRTEDVPSATQADSELWLRDPRRVENYMLKMIIDQNAIMTR
ncbi:hypothetical protein FRC01_004346, partial [Tulasnella sp. 417]